MKYLAHRCDKCLRDAIVGQEDRLLRIGSSLPLGWVAVEIEIGRRPFDAIAHVVEGIKKATEASVSKSPVDMLGAYIRSAAPLMAGDPSMLVGAPYRVELCSECVASLRVELEGGPAGTFSLLAWAMEQAKAQEAPEADFE